MPTPTPTHTGVDTQLSDGPLRLLASLLGALMMRTDTALKLMDRDDNVLYSKAQIKAGNGQQSTQLQPNITLPISPYIN
jgi:hypothetical protein